MESPTAMGSNPLLAVSSGKRRSPEKSDREVFNSSTSTAIPTPSSPGAKAWSASTSPPITETTAVPLHERILPPTLEELEEMDLAKSIGERENQDTSGDDECPTPTASTASRSQTGGRNGKRVSRQVSRVSGLGRVAHVPVLLDQTHGRLVDTSPGRSSGRSPIRVPLQAPMRSPIRAPASTLPEADKIPRPMRTPKEEVGPRPRPFKRSTSTGNLRQQSWERRHAPGASAAGDDGISHAERRGGARRGPPLTAAGGASRQQRIRPVYHGTPSYQQQDLSKKRAERPTTGYRAAGRGHDEDQVVRAEEMRDDPQQATAIATATGGKPLRRRSNSAPDLAALEFQEMCREDGEDEHYGRAYTPKLDGPDAEDLEEPSESKSPEDSASLAQAIWGGGLPPKRGVIAQGPVTARQAAVRAPVSKERFKPAPSGRPSVGQKYPSNDRESFARTLNEEELDEVWRGLGEGVSQRGAGSEVAFDGGSPPSPNGTAVSGAFPKLTHTLLQRFEQMVKDGGEEQGQEEGVDLKIMPLPKGVAEDGNMKDVEAGTLRSKKSSSGSSSGRTTSLLSAVVSYGVLVLFMAHLVFNMMML